MSEQQDGWKEWSRHVLSELERLNDKIDEFLARQSEHSSQIAVLDSRIDRVESRVDRLEDKHDATSGTLTTLQVGLAERFGPGAVAGAAAAFFMLIVKFVVGI